MDCILGYHMNPLTCGVAKFNLLLGRETGKPNLSVFKDINAEFSEPLLSLKVSEFLPDDRLGLRQVLDTAPWRDSFHLFLHEWTGSELEERLLSQAKSVTVGNAELAAVIRPVRPDVNELWCPGMLIDTLRFEPCELSAFSFGMAHKLRPTYYRKLRELLEATGKSYCLYLSTALHEETSFDDSFLGAFNELRKIFGDRVYFLGYLSDSAVYNYLSDATYFAAFFDKGVRANNTTVHSAMQCGAVVITNLSEYSPGEFAHMENVIDINRCDRLPTSRESLAEISRKGRELAGGKFGWRSFVERMMGKEVSL